MKKALLLLIAVSSLIIVIFLIRRGGSSPDTDQEIEKLLSQMSLEEKAGQMTNLTLTTIAAEEGNSILIDPEKLRNVIVNHHVGSIQNVVTHAYTLEEWRSIITTIQDVSLKETRLKIPFLYCIDAVHGTNYTINSTLFPHNLGIAASRNPELARRCGEITAAEMRASGIRYNFSPVLDVGRQPLWPRFAETFGEDVYIVSVLGTATIRGYEGDDLKNAGSVASCMKHFVGYAVPASGRDRAPAYIPEIVLREYFLPPFKAAVDAGARTLMVNSGDVNGVPVHASKFLLTEVLRKEMGFKGVVISDWEDVKKLHERHRTADSQKEAVRQTVEAGIDMCIVPNDFSFYEYLIELVKENKISMQRIDESVRRILQLKADLGLFENPYPEEDAIKNLAKPEYKQVALDAARESIVLMKNESNLLPLDKNKKILVTGPNAFSLTTLNGAWSYTWQGRDSRFFSPEELTIAEAMKKKAGSNFREWKMNYADPGFNIAEIKKMAAGADIIVLCLGEDAYAETPGNIQELELPLAQLELAKAVYAIGKPVVLVLTQGRPRIIRTIEPGAGAVVFAGWPGSQGGNAIAEILYGDYNPDGKLPFTYPKYSGELLTYDHKLLDEAVEETEPEYRYYFKFDPQFEFGHGLSYTKFEYSNLKLSSETMGEKGNIQVSVTVKNTGDRPGKETVELYVRDIFASVTPPVKRLRKFSKIFLEPGASETVIFELLPTDIAFVNQDMQWVTEEGEFEVVVKNVSGKFLFQSK